MKKNWSNKGTQYKNIVELGGRVKETRGQQRPFFPVEVTADSRGAKNLWVELKWLNKVPGNPDVFQLGGGGGDNEWYEAHNILGTINMEPYTGVARTISNTPCPSTGWKYYFIIDRSESDSVQSLLGKGRGRARQTTNKARKRPAAKRKATASTVPVPVPLARAMSAPTGKKGKGKRQAVHNARTQQKCARRPPAPAPPPPPPPPLPPPNSNHVVQREGNDVTYPSCHTPFAHPVTRSRARSENVRLTAGFGTCPISTRMKR
jgi:hypothetical protein